MEELEAIIETGAAAAVEAAASALAERGGTVPPCPNCGKPLIGPFCAVCGQPRNTHRRTLGKLLHDFVKDVVSFDSRILRTAAALVLRPGELPRAFRDGRTQPYVPAVRLYLFVTLIFFLFLSVSGLALIQFGLKAHSVVYSHDAAGHVYMAVDGKNIIVKALKSDAAGKMSAVDPDAGTVIPDEKADGHTTAITFSSSIRFFQPVDHVKNTAPPGLVKALAKLRDEAAKDTSESKWFVKNIATTLSRLETDPAALNGPLITWIPRILFVLLPLFALLLALFYRRQRADYLFVDHLVFSLTLHSFAFVLLIGAALLAQVMAGGPVALIAWALLSLYFYLSLKRFYAQGWIKTGVKFVTISLVYSFFFLCPALGVAIVASVIGN
jgi:hypothetical protein